MLSRTQQHLYNVKTGVRPGCVTSALLFKLVIDWVMRKTTENSQRGFRSCLVSTLEDLNFAGDLVLLSHIHLHNQEKTNRLQATGWPTYKYKENRDNDTYVSANGKIRE